MYYSNLLEHINASKHYDSNNSKHSSENIDIELLFIYFLSKT